MLYLSQLINTKIRDDTDKVIGKLKDILVYPKTGEYSPLEFLAVKIKGRKSLDFIPYEFVENLSHQSIDLKFKFEKIPFQKTVSESFLWLAYDVMDQQIVDLKGARVVRVNDLRLGHFENEICALGIDISTKGLLRRLGIDWMDVFDLLRVHLIDWREVQPIHGILKLDTVAKNLEKLHPDQLADIIEDLNHAHQNKVANALSHQKAANVFERVTPELQHILLKHWGPKKASKILSRVSLKEVVAIVKKLPPDEAEIFMSYLKEKHEI
jgi:magnesium transporter